MVEWLEAIWNWCIYDVGWPLQGFKWLLKSANYSIYNVIALSNASYLVWFWNETHTMTIQLNITKNCPFFMCETLTSINSLPRAISKSEY